MKAPKPMKALSKTVKAMAMKTPAKARKAPMKAMRAPMKAPKSVVKKPVGSQPKQSSVFNQWVKTSRAQKEPPCQIAGIYRTYAVIHQLGTRYNSTRLLNTPNMFMEIGVKGAFVGEVSNGSKDGISIAGSGRIAPLVSGGGLKITEWSATKDCIPTEMNNGPHSQYAGFI